MFSMDLDDYDLDWKSRAVLAALSKADGEATTSDISANTGIENNNIIRYRFHEKLAPAGLIDLHRGDTDTDRTPPIVAVLTDDGLDVAEQLPDERDTAGDIYDEVEKLRAEVQQLQSHVEPGSDSIQDDLDEVSARVDTLADAIEGIEELWEGLLAMRNYLQEVHDADLHAYRPEESE